MVTWAPLQVNGKFSCSILLQPDEGEKHEMKLNEMERRGQGKCMLTSCCVCHLASKNPTLLSAINSERWSKEERRIMCHRRGSGAVWDGKARLQPGLRRWQMYYWSERDVRRDHYKVILQRAILHSKGAISTEEVCFLKMITGDTLHLTLSCLH